MTARSIQRVPGLKKKRHGLLRVAALLSILALLTLAIGIVSFTTADAMMRQKPQPLPSISSNIMPVWQAANFPSFNEQTTLSGALFLAQGPAVSTIILVHDQDSNRFVFGLDSPKLFETLTRLGFNVLAFDLRNAGRSEGEMSGFGYAEWEDVLAAIRYVHRVSSTRDVLLYGIGTGVSASLIALSQLPLPDQPRDDLPLLLRELPFDRSYVRGLLLDTPAVSPDSYIRAAVRDQGGFAADWLQYTVPSAVRLSAGDVGTTSLVSQLSRLTLPVFIAYSTNDSRIPLGDIEPLINERLRLHPETTVVFTSETAGRSASFSLDQAAYLEALDRYFRRYFPQKATE